MGFKSISHKRIIIIMLRLVLKQFHLPHVIIAVQPWLTTAVRKPTKLFSSDTICTYVLYVFLNYVQCISVLPLIKQIVNVFNSVEFIIIVIITFFVLEEPLIPLFILKKIGIEKPLVFDIIKKLLDKIFK